ncbi:unnamed protein product [Effrenium voratum]|nr:unnamed protein product [Effrenium voratum]
MGKCQSQPQGQKHRGSVHRQLHPMWVVSVKDVLQMPKLQCHQDLLTAGMLKSWEPGLFTIFVSHQWLGFAHPDANGAQFRVLKGVLGKLISGQLKLELDMTSQFFGHQKSLTAWELEDAYLWFDWFSVPQACHHSAGPDVSESSKLCIRSIPFYVDACQMFVALVPNLLHNDTERHCNYFTWLSRGWCRAEMWCKLLSEKSDIPIVVVTASDQAEFAMPMHWLNCPVHAGDFTVEADREEVCQLIRVALDSKLLHLESKCPGDDFRFYAARYEGLAGLPPKLRTPEDLAPDFRFPSLPAALKKTHGLGPLHCAVLAQDVELLETLLEKGAKFSKMPEMVELDILPDCTPLHLAVMHSGGARGAATLRALLKSGVEVNLSNRLGHPVLGLCSTAEAVDMLIEARAEVNRLRPPTMVSALTLACLRLASPEVIGRLLERKADANLVQGGIGLAPLHSLAINGHSNPHCLAVAGLLLDAAADPNQPCRAGLLFRAVELTCRGLARLKEVSGLVRVLSEGSTTPLGYAALFGAEPLVDFLIEAGADPTLKNNRGHTPAQLARHAEVCTTISQRTRAEMD